MIAELLFLSLKPSITEMPVGFIKMDSFQAKTMVSNQNMMVFNKERWFLR